jgi:hypothetical protein
VTRWLRNQQQADRYNCTVKSVERARRYGRLPKAEYPFGNRFPANTEEQLDHHDRAMAMSRSRVSDEEIERLYREASAAATRAEGAAIVDAFDFGRLGEIQREYVKERLTDILSELPTGEGEAE